MENLQGGDSTNKTKEGDVDYQVSDFVAFESENISNVKADVVHLKLLKGVLNGIYDIIRVYNPDNTIAFFNQAGYDFYKKTPSEVKGKKCYEVLYRGERCTSCIVEEAIRTKKMISMEKYIPEYNKYMEYNCNPVMDNLGKVMFIVEQLRDITEKKMLENILKESEERYRQIINFSPEAMLIVEDNKVVLANNQLCKLIGVEYEKFIGESIYKYIPVSFIKNAHKIIKQVMVKKKTNIIYEYTFLNSRGEVNEIEISASYLAYKSRPAVQAVIRNVTQIKKGINETAKIQRQALQMSFPIPSKVNMESLYVPAKIVSGDFYILYKINEDLVVGLIGDVSGKGVTAALNISAFNVLFHEAVTVSNDPFEIINNLNRKIVNYIGERYIAACCFSFDFKKNEAKIVGAGINELIFKKNNDKAETVVVKGAFLGMFQNSVFDEKIIPFGKGDTFYFFTDGLEFIINDKIKENYLQRYSITQFKYYLSKVLNNMLTDIDGIKDDSTIIALEIK